MNRFIVIIAFAISSLYSYAHNDGTQCYHKDPKGTAREKTAYFYHLDLDIKLKELESRVEGTATYDFHYLRKEIDTLFLDAVEFDVTSVKINSESVGYRVDSAGIVIRLPKAKKDTNVLEIKYSCYPKRGIYFLNWNNPDPIAKKQIWTQGQGIDNRHWIPGFDDVSDLLTVTSHINFNKKYPLVSNGDLIDTKELPDNTKTWTYRMTKPHALYLIMIGAGDYKVKKSKTKNNITLEQYYYPELEAHFNATYEHSEVMMDWFEQETGVHFPWGKVYRNVPTQDFLYGAMENTTSTIFTDYMHQDTRSALERAYIGVNAHELAHQWFGDFITERSGKHHWLHESFATHYSKRFLSHLRGTDEFDWIRKGERDAIFSAGKVNSLPIANSQSGSSRHYPKGSFVLDMLRNELGNENYRKSITYYLRKFGHKNVETNDLIASIYEATGRNVSNFFDQWIYRGGEPELKVDYTVNNKSLHLTTHQFQATIEDVSIFDMSMELLIQYKDKSTEVKTVHIHRLRDTFTLPLSKNDSVQFVLLDPDMKFLRKINYKSGVAYDLDILKHSTSTMARLEAAERLKSADWNQKKKEYLDAYHNETSPLIKKELVSQISTEDSSEVVSDILYHAYKDKHFLVRREAINATFFRFPEIKNLMVESTQDSSYVNIEQAVNKLIALYPNETNQWIQSISTLKGSSNNLSILHNTLILKQNNKTSLEYQKALSKLKYLASPSYEFRTRVSAMQILQNNNIFDEEICSGLLQGTQYFNPMIRNTALNYLAAFKSEYSGMIDKVISSYKFRNEKEKKQLVQTLNKMTK